MTSLGLYLGFVRSKISGAIASFLVQDTFTDTNGTSLTAHTPDIDTVGGGWIVDSGTIDIQNNQANPAAPSSVVNLVGYIAIGTVSCVINTLIHTASIANTLLAGPALRVANQLNFFTISALRVGGANDGWIVLEVTSGGGALRAKKNETISYDTDYQMTVTTDATQMSLDVDDVFKVSYSSTSKNTNENVGMRWQYGSASPDDTTSTMDNFEVTPG